MLFSDAWLAPTGSAPSVQDGALWCAADPTGELNPRPFSAGGGLGLTSLDFSWITDVKGIWLQRNFPYPRLINFEDTFLYNFMTINPKNDLWPVTYFSRPCQARICHSTATLRWHGYSFVINLIKTGCWSYLRPMVMTQAHFGTVILVQGHFRAYKATWVFSVQLHFETR